MPGLADALPVGRSESFNSCDARPVREPPRFLHPRPVPGARAGGRCARAKRKRSGPDPAPGGAARSRVSRGVHALWRLHDRLPGGRAHAGGGRARPGGGHTAAAARCERVRDVLRHAVRARLSHGRTRGAARPLVARSPRFDRDRRGAVHRDESRRRLRRVRARLSGRFERAPDGRERASKDRAGVHRVWNLHFRVRHSPQLHPPHFMNDHT